MSRIRAASSCLTSVLGMCHSPKIGLEGVNTNVQQVLQVLGVPFDSVGISEIDNTHASLPNIALPDISIRTLDQVAFLGSFVEYTRFLGDVWVYPDTYSEPSLMDSREKGFGVGKEFLVEGKVCPLMCLKHKQAGSVVSQVCTPSFCGLLSSRNSQNGVHSSGSLDLACHPAAQSLPPRCSP